MHITRPVHELTHCAGPEPVLQQVAPPQSAEPLHSADEPPLPPLGDPPLELPLAPPLEAPPAALPLTPPLLAPPLLAPPLLAPPLLEPPLLAPPLLAPPLLAPPLLAPPLLEPPLLVPPAEVPPLPPSSDDEPQAARVSDTKSQARPAICSRIARIISVMRILFSMALLCALGVPACGDESGSNDAPGSGGSASGGAAGSGGASGAGGSTGGSAGSAGCAFQLSKDGRTLCAVEPASSPGISNTFGYHAVGLPATIGASTPVYVHLVGSGGDPAKPATQAFPNQLLMEELTALGVLVLMPAYDNEPAVGMLCKLDLACYEPVRREVLFGVDAPAPYAALKDVQKPNDIVSRLGALVKSVTDAGLLGATPPEALADGKVDVAKLRVGGHSQGGGHAALFAKDFAVARLCMFSSPMDGTDTGGVGTAVPWVSGAWATGLEKRRAVIHEQDPGFLKAKANFDAMGLVEGTHWTRLTLTTSEPHASTVKDAATAAARASCVD